MLRSTQRMWLVKVMTAERASPDRSRARAVRREAFLSVVLCTVHQELDGLEKKLGEHPYAHAVQSVESPEQATRDRVM